MIPIHKAVKRDNQVLQYSYTIFLRHLEYLRDHASTSADKAAIQKGIDNINIGYATAYAAAKRTIADNIEQIVKEQAA